MQMHFSPAALTMPLRREWRWADGRIMVRVAVKGPLHHNLGSGSSGKQKSFGRLTWRGPLCACADDVYSAGSRGLNSRVT